MARERNIRKIVWSDDRDSIFLKWFAEDVALLLDTGFSLDEAKKMLCSLSYVKYWATNPSWLYPIAGLPKGFHWRDGQKFVQKRTRRSDGRTYVFLPIGEDLYIKGICAVGTHKSDYQGAKIKQYRKLSSYEVTAQLAVHDPFFESSVLTFWRSQGLRLFADPSYLHSLHG